MMVDSKAVPLVDWMDLQSVNQKVALSADQTAGTWVDGRAAMSDHRKVDS